MSEDDHYAAWQECLSANAAKDSRIAELEAEAVELEGHIEFERSRANELHDQNGIDRKRITLLEGLLREARQYIYYDEGKVIARIDSALKTD